MPTAAEAGLAALDSHGELIQPWIFACNIGPSLPEQRTGTSVSALLTERLRRADKQLCGDRVNHGAGCALRLQGPISMQDPIGAMQNAPRVMPLRRGDLIFEELDGEALLYDPRCGAIHHFNGMTLYVWNACDGLRTSTDIASALAEQHLISPDEALVHVERLIAEFWARDLLQGRCREAKTDLSWGMVQPTTKAIMDVTATSKAARDAVSSLHPPDRSQTELPSLSRRELVTRGVVKLVFVAPVISTFFTPTAYGDGSGPASASGPGGCKNVGFSCAVNADCCEFDTNTACQDQGGPTKQCCVQHLRPGCTIDDDCCNLTDTCIGGVCQ